MGVWGTGIFSDDTACDVRDSYIDFVGDGVTGPETTEALLREWSPSLNDPEEAPPFWLALAATQGKCGWLEPHVLQQALNVIDGGSDLERWESGSKDFKKRKGVLFWPAELAQCDFQGSCEYCYHSCHGYAPACCRSHPVL